MFLGLALESASSNGAEVLAPELTQKADALYEKALSENYRPEGLDLMKKSLDLCVVLLEANPEKYELLWRCARSALQIAETAKILKNPDWKQLYVPLLKKSIDWAEAAQEIEPDRIEAYFWQMKALGLAYEAQGPIAFIAMGYAPKSRRNIDACCAIDPSYMDYTPILAHALYLFTAPPFLGKDIAKAHNCCREFMANTRWGFEPYRQLMEVAGVLISTREKECIERARSLLHAALADPTPRPFYHEAAAAMLARIEMSSK